MNPYYATPRDARLRLSFDSSGLRALGSLPVGGQEIKASLRNVAGGGWDRQHGHDVRTERSC
jgi:hypothetical protein